MYTHVLLKMATAHVLKILQLSFMGPGGARGVHMHVWCVRCILQIIKLHTYKLLREALLAAYILAATSTCVI